MTPNEIYEKLKAKFDEAKVPGFVENEAGDNWVSVTPDAIAEVCLFLRDDSI